MIESKVNCRVAFGIATLALPAKDKNMTVTAVGVFAVFIPPPFKFFSSQFSV